MQLRLRRHRRRLQLSCRHFQCPTRQLLARLPHLPNPLGAGEGAAAPLAAGGQDLWWRLSLPLRALQARLRNPPQGVGEHSWAVRFASHPQSRFHAVGPVGPAASARPDGSTGAVFAGVNAHG